jgi:PIN domain nuclease of toxin-antitoxin system
MLWVLQGSSRITRKAVEAYKDMNNEVFFSAVSYWEMCLKISLEKLM